MNKFIALAASMMLIFAAASCSENNKPEQGDDTIKIDVEVVESSDKVEIEATFTCAKKQMDYAYGVARVEDVELSGSLIVYITEQLAEGKARVASEFPKIDLFEIKKLAKYIVYAAPIKDKGVNGTISSSDTIQVLSSYIEYTPEIVAAPAAVSDNGHYIVGNLISMENSYIYDLTRYEDSLLEAVVLYDITDDGSIAVGTDSDNKACIWNNGEITVLQKSGTGTMWAITPDGTKAVGEIAGDPVVYQNGAITTLSLEGATGTNGCGIATGIAKQIGTNGVIAGLVFDEATAPLHAYWDVAGNLHVIGEGENTIDVKDEINFMYGGWANEDIKMSPNGRYISGTVFDAEGLVTLLYPYILDTETGELHVASIAEFEMYNDYSSIEYEIHPRVDVVTNEGEVLFSVTSLGESEVPYVYTKDGGVDYLQNYLEDKYGKEIQPDMVGSPCAASADGKVITLSHQYTGGYITDIYLF